MRLTYAQIESIRQATREIAGPGARVRLFGSRLDDDARGGDVDLMVECDDPVEDPALLAARIGAIVTRALRGRRVDVVVKAPNLRQLPIHEAAARGILL